jgi:hypothetical protein
VISAVLPGRSSPTDSMNRQQDQFSQDAETTLTGVSISGAMISDSWAWVELNYRPHAYQAASYEHEIGSEVPTRLPFTNILLSISRIYEHLAHLGEHFAHADGHHNGHHGSDV